MRKIVLPLALCIYGLNHVYADPVTFSGEVRFRPEYRNNADFNRDTQDSNSLVGSRIRLTANAQAADNVTVKLTFQDSRNWGEENSAVGLTNSGPQSIDLHEGYVEFNRFVNAPLAFRAGRQELVYGDQRLVGNFGWSNQGRAFDAYKLMYVTDAFSTDVWAAKRKESNGTTAGPPDSDRTFYGVYSTVKNISHTIWDVYALLDREADTAPPNPVKEIYTVGTRVAVKAAGVDFTAELPYQFGHNGTEVAGSSQSVTIEAFAFAGKAGFTFPNSRDVRIGAEYDYASGDNNPSDSKSKTFNNLYPTNHLFYGSMDYQGWRNTNSYSVDLSAKPAKKWFCDAAFWNFGLAQKKDGWYNAAGVDTGTLRSAMPGNTTADVGRELDLTARYAYATNVTFESGYGHFFPGTFITNRVAHSAGSDWSYLMMTVKF